MRNLFELETMRREQAARHVSEAAIPLGELVPWGYSAIYPVTPQAFAKPESDASPLVPLADHDSEHNTEVICNNERGPPILQCCSSCCDEE